MLSYRSGNQDAQFDEISKKYQPGKYLSSVRIGRKNSEPVIQKGDFLVQTKKPKEGHRFNKSVYLTQEEKGKIPSLENHSHEKYRMKLRLGITNSQKHSGTNSPAKPVVLKSQEPMITQKNSSDFPRRASPSGSPMASKCSGKDKEDTFPGLDKSSHKEKPSTKRHEEK